MTRGMRNVVSSTMNRLTPSTPRTYRKFRDSTQTASSTSWYPGLPVSKAPRMPSETMNVASDAVRPMVLATPSARRGTASSATTPASGRNVVTVSQGNVSTSSEPEGHVEEDDHRPDQETQGVGPDQARLDPASQIGQP